MVSISFFHVVLSSTSSSTCNPTLSVSLLHESFHLVFCLPSPYLVRLHSSPVVSYRTRKCSLLWSFWLIRIHIGSRNKFSLVAQEATLSCFLNLHKCKMAATRYVNMCYTRTTCANIKCNTSFKGSLVQGIQI